MKRLSAVLTAAAVLLAVLSGCAGESLSGKGFRFPLSGEPRQIDPQASLDAASAAVMAAVFEGLTALNEKGEAVPGMAEWTASPDGLVYTFELKESYWRYAFGDDDDPYDGMRVTAADFRFAVLRAVTPSTRSPFASLTYGIAGAKKIAEGKAGADALGVKAVSDTKLTITLTEPDSNFPKLLASPPFYPCNEAFFEYTFGQYGLDAEYVLANGPFFIKSWTHGQSVLLNKNDKYHGAESILPAAVRYMIGQTGDPVAEIENGELDAAWLPGEIVGNARESGLPLVMHEDAVQCLWFNMGGGALGNRLVRQAMRAALEWNSITALHDGDYSSPASGFVSPDAVIEGGEVYRTDSNGVFRDESDEPAASMLAKGLDAAGADALGTLTLICAEDEYSLQFARYILQSWQKNLSLYFKIETLSETALADRMIAGNYQLALYSAPVFGDSALDALKYFAEGAGISSSYKKAASKADAGDRKALEALEKMLWDECPAIPVSFPRSYAALNPDAVGINVRPFGGGKQGAPFDFRFAGKPD